MLDEQQVKEMKASAAAAVPQRVKSTGPLPAGRPAWCYDQDCRHARDSAACPRETSTLVSFITDEVALCTVHAPLDAGQRTFADIESKMITLCSRTERCSMTSRTPKGPISPPPTTPHVSTGLGAAAVAEESLSAKKPFMIFTRFLTFCSRSSSSSAPYARRNNRTRRARYKGGERAGGREE